MKLHTPVPRTAHHDAIKAAVAEYRRTRQHLHTTLLSAIADGVQATVVAETTARCWIKNGPPDTWNRRR